MNEKEILSASLEKYLTAIYTLSLTAKKIRITDISRLMSVSKPSVNRAVGELKALGLLEQKPYGNILLTEKGKETAQEIEKRTGILRRFFEDVLGADSECAKRQAEAIGPVTEIQIIKKLEAFMCDYFAEK